jgi:hypothetical protein
VVEASKIAGHTQKIFAEKLTEKGYLNIEIPQKGETFNLN